jgi:hypothetical protein
MKLLLSILFALLCSGCFVIDEIDKGQAIMKAHSAKNEESEKAADAGGSKGSPKSPRERLAEYYAKQRAKAPEPTQDLDPANAVGSCRIAGKVEFMRRSDCKLRGGTFL